MAKISSAEGRIMDMLWRVAQPASSEDIADALAAEADDTGASWSHGTVRTFLTRLVNKGAVAAEKDGRKYLYRSVLDRDAYVRAESQGLLDRLFGGELTPLIHHFAQHRDLTPQELDRLKALIAEIEAKHG
jgi:BlaI family penicillinase repressor